MNQELSFGNFVRQRRRELDLTQEELARRVGCAAITLRKIEADDLRASVQIAERLAMALAIPLAERAEFVRRARAVRPESAEAALVTPPPTMEEIGLEDLTGRAIRGYALSERIGMGGMGSVYRAVQPNVEREVACALPIWRGASQPCAGIIRCHPLEPLFLLMGWRSDLCQWQTQAQDALEQELKETPQLLLRLRAGGHHSARLHFLQNLQRDQSLS